MSYAVRGDGLHAFLDGLVERGGDAHVEAATDEGETERFSGHFSEANANPAQNAFSRLEKNASRLDLLFERRTLPGAITTRIGSVDLCVILKRAMAR